MMYIIFQGHRPFGSREEDFFMFLSNDNTKMAAMPIYGKNARNIFFSRTKKLITLKTGMQHRVLEYYQVCSNDNTGLTLTYFTTKSNLVPYAFVWEKGKTMDFLEAIVVYDVKVASCSSLNDYMNYQRSWSFIDLGPRSLRFNSFEFLFLRN